MNKTIRIFILTITCILLLSIADAAERKQLRILPDSKKPRFKITGRVWPESPDKPHICLWKDDTLAAVSISIDDNTQGDHPWWIEKGKKYNLRFTWFVITCFLNSDKSYRGTWDQFRTLYKEGHDVQSHTVTHIVKGRGYDPDDPEKNLDAEYRKSIEHIEKEVKGEKVLTMAYPGGKYQRTQNDPKVAEKYYIACRGGTGYSVAKANNINYTKVPSSSIGLDGPLGIKTLLDPKNKNYRGWKAPFTHGIKGQEAKIEEALKFLDENRKDIWTSFFRHAAQYAQERDTGKVLNVNVSANEISFSVTDDMDDTIFDFPLTVKVRLPKEWSSCTGTQNGKEAGVRLIEHEGSRYVLVDAVPDKGTIVISHQ